MTDWNRLSRLKCICPYVCPRCSIKAAKKRKEEIANNVMDCPILPKGKDLMYSLIDALKKEFISDMGLPIDSFMPIIPRREFIDPAREVNFTQVPIGKAIDCPSTFIPKDDVMYQLITEGRVEIITDKDLRQRKIKI